MIDKTIIGDENLDEVIVVENNKEVTLKWGSFERSITPEEYKAIDDNV